MLFLLYRPECSAYSFLSIFLPYMISVLIHMLKAMYTARQYSLQDQISNSQKIEKLNQKDHNIIQPKSIQWKNVELGDIVRVEASQRAPADLIILDSYEKSFFVNSNFLDGKSIPTMKYPLRLTYVSRQSQEQKEKFQNFRRHLVGKIQYRVNQGEQSYYSGSLKLKSDPTSENITTENILYKNTILHNTKWIYGMVIGTGCDCQMDKWKRKTIQKTSVMDNMIEKFTGLLIVIFTLLSILFRILIQESDYQEFTYLNDPTTSQVRTDIRSFWISFMVDALPLFIYAVSDIVSVLEARKIQKKYMNKIQIKNVSALENIAFVDWCFFDKTQTLTQNNFEVEGFIIDQQFFNAGMIKSQRTKVLQKEISNDLDAPSRKQSKNITQSNSIKVKITNPSSNSIQSSQQQNLGGIGLSLKNKIQMVQVNITDISQDANNQEESRKEQNNEESDNGQELITPQHIGDSPSEEFQIPEGKLQQYKMQIEKIDEVGESIIANSSHIDSLDKNQQKYRQQNMQSMKFSHYNNNNNIQNGTNSNLATKTQYYQHKNNDMNFSNIGSDVSIQHEQNKSQSDRNSQTPSPVIQINQRQNFKNSINLSMQSQQDNNANSKNLEKETNENLGNENQETNRELMQNQDFISPQITQREDKTSSKPSKESIKQEEYDENEDNSDDNESQSPLDSPKKKRARQSQEQEYEDHDEIPSEGSRVVKVKSFQLHYEGGVSIQLIDSERTHTAFPQSSQVFLNPSNTQKTEEELLRSSYNNDQKNTSPSSLQAIYFTKGVQKTKHQRKNELFDSNNSQQNILTENDHQQNNNSNLQKKYSKVSEEDENANQDDSPQGNPFDKDYMMTQNFNQDNLETQNSQLDLSRELSEKRKQPQIKVKSSKEQQDQLQIEKEQQENREGESGEILRITNQENLPTLEQSSKQNQIFSSYQHHLIQYQNKQKKGEIRGTYEDEHNQCLPNKPGRPSIFKEDPIQQGDGDKQEIDSLQFTSDQIKEEENDFQDFPIKIAHSRSSSSTSHAKSSPQSPFRLSKFAQQSLDIDNLELNKEKQSLQTPPKLVQGFNLQLNEEQKTMQFGIDSLNVVDMNDGKNIIAQAEIQFDTNDFKNNNNNNGQVNENQAISNFEAIRQKTEQLQKKYFISSGNTVSFQKLGSGIQSLNGGTGSYDNFSQPNSPLRKQSSQLTHNGIMFEQEKKIKEKIFALQEGNSLPELEVNSSKLIQTPQLFGQGDQNLFRFPTKDSNNSPLPKQNKINSIQSSGSNYLNNLDFAQSKPLVIFSSESMKQQMKDSKGNDQNQIIREDIQELQYLQNNVKFSSQLLRNLYDSDFDSQGIQVEDFQITEKENLQQKELKKYDNFIKAVMLCRQWKLKMLPDSDFYSIEFLKPEDESISRFFRYLKINLQVGTKKELEGKCYFHLPNLNENNKLQIIVQNYPSPKKPNTLFAIVQDHFFGTYHLYVKSDASILDKMKLNTQQKQVLREYFESKMEHGQRVQLYGQRPLLSKDVQSFLAKYHQIKAAHFDDQTKQYDDLFEEIEFDLDYLGVLFISNNLNKGVVNYVTQMDNLLVKMAVLSGDSHDYVMQTAKSSAIIEDQMENIKIEGEKHDDIESSIKQHISQIKKKMFSPRDDEDEFMLQDNHMNQSDNPSQLNGISKSQKPRRLSKRVTKTQHYNQLQNAILQLEKRVVIVKGSQLKIISSNPTLEAHFIFLIANSERIVGTELTAIQKGYFVEIIKHIDSNSKIMSVGDGYNDCLMMQLSDISVEVSCSNSFLLLQQKHQQHVFQQKNQTQIQKAKEKNKLQIPALKKISSSKSAQSNQITSDKKLKMDLEPIENQTRISNNSGDIFLKSPDFSLLQEFTFKESFNLARKKYFIIVEAFYQSFLYLILNFCLNVNTLSSSTLFNSVDYVVFYIFFFGIKLIFFGNYYNNDLISMLTERYAQTIYNFNISFLQRASSSLSLFLLSIFPAIFDSILILVVATLSQSLNYSTDLLRAFIILSLILVNTVRLHNNSPDEDMQNNITQTQQASSKQNSRATQNMIKSKEKQTSLEEGMHGKLQQQQQQNLQIQNILKFFKSNLLLMIVFDLIVYFAYFGINYQYSKQQSSSPQQAFNINELLQLSECYLGLFVVISLSKIFHFFYIDFIKRRFVDKEIYEIISYLTEEGDVIWRDFYNKSSNLIQYYKIPIETVIKKVFAKVKMDINVEQILSPDDYHQQMEQGEYSKISLNFISKKLMAQYSKIMIPNQIKQARVIIIALITLNILLIIFTSIFNEKLERVTQTSNFSNLHSLLLLIAFTVLLLLFFIVLYTKFSEDRFQYIIISLLIYFGMYQIIYPWAFEQVLSFKEMILFLVISYLPFPIHLILIHHVILFLNQIIWYFYYQSCDQDNSCLLKPIDQFDEKFTSYKAYLFINFVAYYLHVIINSYTGQYFFIRNQNIHYLQIRRLKEEKSQSSDVLGLLLPEFVKDEVNQCQGEYLIEKSSDNVLILFCDIYQFDKILSEEGERITELLDTLFRQFDILCKQEGIQKIETVGKTYMACGGLKDIEKRLPKEILKYDVSERIVNLAIQMIVRASQITWGENDEHLGIALKIGINSGPVIAGVIGLHKPQFSLIGDTVNTTSRVCANCKEGQISISQKVYERVKGIRPDWGFKQHSFEAKGKGTLVCYYINLRDESALIQPQSAMHKYSSQMQVSRTPLIMLKSINNQERFLNGFQNNRINTQNSYTLPQTIGIYGGGGGYSSHSLQNSQNINKQVKLMDVYQNDKLINRKNQNKKRTVYLNDLMDDEISATNKSNYQQSDLNGNIHSPSLVSPNKQENISMDDSIKKYHRDDFIRETAEQKQPVGNHIMPKTVIFTAVDTPIRPYKKKFAQELQVRVTNEERASNGVSETPSKINIGKQIQNTNSSNQLPQQQLQQQMSGQNQKQMTQTFPDQDDTDEDDDEDRMQDINNSRSYIFSQKSQDQQGNNIVVNRFLQYNYQGDRQIYNDYEEQTLLSYWTPFKILIASTIFINFLHTIVKLSSGKNTSTNAVWYAIDFSCQAGFFFFLLMRDYLISKKKMRLIFAIFINISFLAIIGDASEQNQEPMLIHFSIMRITCNFYLMNHSYCLYFIEQFSLTILWLLIYIFWVLVPYSKFSIQYLYLLICPIFFLLYQRYSFVRTEISNYNKISIAIEQNTKQLKLLVYLLPPHILDKFFKDTTKRSELTHRLKNIPILVADIAGFTAYSNSVQPTEVVKMLYNLFIKFDLSCTKHNVFKLYTIGDCYMVLGFKDTQMRNVVTEAYNTLEMAFSMVKIIQKVKKEINFEGLNMRIGLHIGDIIGGVIGTDIVRYDVYGKSVVIANKMESNSTTGRIRISEDYKKILLDNFSSLYEFEDEQTVDCPSISEIVQSWLVYKKDEI